MDAILVDLGLIKIHWYSVMIFLGLLVGGILVIKEAKKWKIPEEFVTNVMFYSIIFGVIGARLYYVAFNWSYYSQDIISIFKIWEGGLAIHGAIIGALFVIIFYTKKYKCRTFRLLDITVVGLIIGQAIGRWGNFFNGEAHGPATTLEALQNLFIPNFIIEGMNINGVYYHPTFLYESLWCILGFIILLIFRKLKYTKIGQTTGLYLIWYGIGRFLIESLRTDSLMFGNIKMAQVISIIMIVIGIVVMIAKGAGSRFQNQYNDEANIDEIRF